MSPHPDIEALSSFMDGEADDNESIRAHLENCADCRESIAALRATQDDLLLLSNPALDEVSSRRIRSAMHPQRKISRIVYLSGAAAAVVVVLAGVFVLRNASHVSNSASSGGPRASSRFALQQSNANFDDASLTNSLVALGAGGSAGANDRAGSVENAQAPGSAGGFGSAASSGAHPQVYQDAQLSSASLERAAERCFQEQVAPVTKEAVIFKQVLAAKYKGEPVYLYFFELPAAHPKRIEVWGLLRTTCAVRIFRQAPLR